MRKSTAAGQCGERCKGELCAGEWSSNPQPVTKTEKNYMGCLFGENVFYLQQVEVLSMDFWTPKRSQWSRSTEAWLLENSQGRSLEQTSISYWLLKTTEIAFLLQPDVLEFKIISY